jgi:hypothetical protein
MFSVCDFVLCRSSRLGLEFAFSGRGGSSVSNVLTGCHDDGWLVARLLSDTVWGTRQTGFELTSKRFGGEGEGGSDV